LIERVAQPLIWRHALNWVQHLRLQPATSLVTSRASAEQMPLQDVKSLWQTRTL